MSARSSRPYSEATASKAKWLDTRAIVRVAEEIFIFLLPVQDFVLGTISKGDVFINCVILGNLSFH
jgi:hypothetical protein